MNVLLRRFWHNGRNAFLSYHRRCLSINVAKVLRDIDTATKIQGLQAVERKSIWLGSYIVHNANTLREKRVLLIYFHDILNSNHYQDGLKVGGHQASSASSATILTALYCGFMGPNDRIAVKPHASPIMHSIQYLLGNQTLDQLQRFRSFGGIQSYPSRTKDNVRYRESALATSDRILPIDRCRF